MCEARPRARFSTWSTAPATTWAAPGSSTWTRAARSRRAVDLSGARFRAVHLTGVDLIDVEPVDARIDGEVRRRHRRALPVRPCLPVVLTEAWHHRQSAERDLVVPARGRVRERPSGVLSRP